MRWPWSRDRSGVQRAEESLADAEAQLAAVDASDPAVDAVHAEHVRRQRQDDFGRMMAAALHLRRVR